MAQRLPYDPNLQMLIEPPIQFSNIDVNRLRFLRWMLVERPDQIADGEIVSDSKGELVDFLVERAKRESGEESVAAA